MKRSARLNAERHKDIKTIKKKFYNIIEHTADCSAEERNPQIERWLGWSEKLTVSIRKKRAKKTLQKLKNETTKGKIKKQPRDKNDE